MARKPKDELTCTLSLLALATIQGMHQKEQVKLMHRAGFDRHRIAELVGTTPLTVSVTITNLKKSDKKGKKRGKK